MAKTYSFVIEGGGAPSFHAGQFFNFVFEIDGQRHSRSYSICSPDTRSACLSITVRRDPNGYVSNWLFDNMEVGRTIRATGPLGTFHCADLPADAPLLLITAGSGITPAAAMMQAFADRETSRSVVFVHYASRPDEMLFARDMEHWASKLRHARIIPIITRPPEYSGWVGPTGRVTQGQLAGLVTDIATRFVFCCGPTGFMQKISDIASALGVPNENFHSESFGGSEGPAPDPTPLAQTGPMIEVGFSRSDTRSEVAPGQTILDAARSAGVHIQTSCRKGVCGTCRVRIEEGSVDIRHQGGISQREIDKGFALACCSLPLGKVIIRA